MLGAHPAMALPDAGMLLQQIERDLKPPVPESVKPARPEPLRKLTGTAITVKEFRFSGNTLISSDVLKRVVAPYLNRPLDFALLQEAAASVGSAYREAGWVVRAYLPQQEIDDGIVTIEIVEAVFGGTHFEGKHATRLSNETIEKYVVAVQNKYVPLSSAAVDRVLLLLGDMPGVQVAGRLSEGEDQAQTDLVFKVEDKPVFSGDTSVDNSGSRSTGSEHVSANLRLNGPFAVGDQFVGSLMSSAGSDYARIGFTRPAGYQGWRVGGSASHMAYRLIAADFLQLKARGISDTAGLEANYPIIRSRLNNLNFFLNYDHKSFNNEANLATVTRYSVDTMSVGINDNLTDSGGGINNFGLGWVHGRVNLNGSPNQASDAATTKTGGSFNKLRYTANRLQPLNDWLTAYFSISGQLADKNLDSGEKFYLGGANGVRAYPASEGGGSDGQMINVELRARMNRSFSLTGFYDLGHVTVNRNNVFAGAPALNNYALQGAGVNAFWFSDFGLTLKATWARRMGKNPNPTATGNDQDGTLVYNRLWLQAALSF